MRVKVICTRTGKATYGTYWSAMADCHPGQRGYRCEFCHFFHRTSHAYDAQRGAKRAAARAAG